MALKTEFYVMKLTTLQRRAYDTAATENGAIVAGYAGTGKTEVLKELALNIGYDVLCPTNKAATVLRDKGIARAMTYHKAIYNPLIGKELRLDALGNPIPVLDDDGVPLMERGEPVYEIDETVNFEPKESDGMMEGCFVDEGSMLGPDALTDLRAAYRNVVIFGDPAQLPPVKAKSVFKEEAVSVFLDEVHRVAMGNPITAFATSVREGREDRSLINRTKNDGGTIFAVDRCSANAMERFVEENYKLICWSNKRRRQLNEQYRTELGLEFGTLSKGDKLICLRSVYGSDRELVAFNGLEGTCIEEQGPTTSRRKLVKTSFGPVWAEPFWQGDTVKELDYAYAVTCHKAQGSEWDNVAVFDQRRWMKSHKMEWFYTAVTRAKEKLVIVG
jgi:exodeoxyribonuclease-5